MRISEESRGSLRTPPTFILFLAPEPLLPAAYLHGRFLFSDADATRETFREIPSIILVHALALWPRKFARKWVIQFRDSRFSNVSVPYTIFRTCIIPDHLHDLIVSKYRSKSWQFYWISWNPTKFCNSILLIKKLCKAGFINHLKI